MTHMGVTCKIEGCIFNPWDSYLQNILHYVEQDRFVSNFDQFCQFCRKLYLKLGRETTSISTLQGLDFWIRTVWFSTPSSKSPGCSWMLSRAQAWSKGPSLVMLRMHRAPASSAAAKSTPKASWWSLLSGTASRPSRVSWSCSKQLQHLFWWCTTPSHSGHERYKSKSDLPSSPYQDSNTLKFEIVTPPMSWTERFDMVIWLRALTSILGVMLLSLSIW